MLYHFDGLVQERRNSSALAIELRFSCTNPSIYFVLVPRKIHLQSVNFDNPNLKFDWLQKFRIVFRELVSTDYTILIGMYHFGISFKPENLKS